MFVFVSCYISLKLRLPKVNVALGHRCYLASFVPMPEASVHENDRVPLGQDNVGMPRQLGVMQTVAESQCMQMTAHEHLRLRVL